MTRTKPYPGTQSIRRAVRVLKAFTEERPEWTLADLSASLDLNKTTAYRLLAALEHEGLVTRAPDGESYRLGPELIVLGSRALRTTDLRTVSRPELEALAQEADETATLEVLVEGEVLILDEAKGPGLLGAHAEVGTRWPAYATSTGKALLAARETFHGEAGAGHAAEWEIPETLPDLAPGTITTAAALRSEFERIREQGYAVAHEELQPGYSAVGAAVRDHEGRGIAAVALGGPTSRFDEARVAALGALVRGAADRISARLGARIATDDERMKETA